MNIGLHIRGANKLFNVIQVLGSPCRFFTFSRTSRKENGRIKRKCNDKYALQNFIIYSTKEKNETLTFAFYSA